MQTGQRSEQILDESQPRAAFLAYQDGQEQRTGQNVGIWNQEENAKYIAYLEGYRHNFSSRQARRTTKFYKKMAQFILTRNSLQCRTHHQKLEAKYRYPNRIISDYKKSTDLTLYHAYKQQFYRMYPSVKSSKGRSTVQRCEIAVQTDISGVSLRLIAEQDWEKERQQEIAGSEMANMALNQVESQLWHTQSGMGAVPFFYYPYFKNGSL